MRDHIYHWVVIAMAISQIAKLAHHFIDKIWPSKVPSPVAATVLSLAVIVPALFYSVEASRDLI
jgi:hypothetical protein